MIASRRQISSDDAGVPILADDEIFSSAAADAHFVGQANMKRGHIFRSVIP